MKATETIVLPIERGEKIDGEYFREPLGLVLTGPGLPFVELGGTREELRKLLTFMLDMVDCLPQPLHPVEIIDDVIVCTHCAVRGIDLDAIRTLPCCPDLTKGHVWSMEVTDPWTPGVRNRVCIRCEQSDPTVDCADISGANAA